MTRTPLMERDMPFYTKAEERMNMITHIVGGAIAVAALVLCIIRSAMHHSGVGIASSIVFGVSMILLYTMSSIYHGLPDGRGKRVMQVLDHCSVYILIAGSYTPVLLCGLARVDKVSAWVIFGIVWGLAAAAIVLNSIDLKSFKHISMVLYLLMGWTIIFKLPVLIQAIGMPAFWLILAGGILYTIGAILYGLGRTRRYMHSIFHIFVVAGSICHVLAILLYIL
ncbi:MAG: hemolysin III family protein [Clostridia bacterium]|nr:hemolysin III family protein [Clostridia bacterium]